MIPVSDRFLASLKSDATEINIVELWWQDQFLRNLDLDESSPGSLTLDSGADVLRQISINLVEPTEIPGKTPDELWPIGPELKLFSGFVYSDGTDELIPQGVYILHNPVVDHAENKLQTSLTGFDRSMSIRENRFGRPFPLDSMNVAVAIETIILDRVPNVNFQLKFEPTAYVIPPVILQHGGQSDPWKDCLDLAESAGMEIFFDGLGDLVLRAIPSVNTPIFSYTDVPDEGIILETRREIDRSTAYSGVTLTSENPAADPEFVEIWDTDQNSPTNVATFGPKPYFIDTQFISVGETNRPIDVAQKKLSEVRGIAESMTFKAVANFAHEQNDVITVQDEKTNIDGVYQIKAYSRSLQVGASLDIVNQKKRVTAIG